MRYAIIAVTFVLAAVAMSVWHNRNAELETALTRPQVFAHCVVGVAGDRYTAQQFVPCLRAGSRRADSNWHRARTLYLRAKLKRNVAQMDEARAALTPWTDE